MTSTTKSNDHISIFKRDGNGGYLTNEVTQYY